ncbi:peptidase M61 [Novosphingobium sp.]|uniref:M61 family metallopeptidase n=1 Tax=Novosphingobium sp. TaxID=1874826 RepID=UPI0025F0A32E|nr:peptidase M61 [Novosphingobium sp.]
MKGKLIALALAAASTAALAANSMPQAVPLSQQVPTARDIPYPGGTILLDVDASDTARGLFRVTETIPLAPNTRRITLLYPQWLPGNHAPTGPITQLVDLQFEANGQKLQWKRDPVELWAFHVELPAGASSVTARFIHTAPLQDSEGRVTMTPDMLNLQWEKMSLYPAGHYVRQIRVRPSLLLPRGWSAATALDGREGQGERLSWAETSYETLVDSPLFAGRHFRKWDLGQGVALNLFADGAEGLAAKDEHIAAYRALVDEALLAFGAKHFDHYDVLLGATDKLGGIGLEHHRSSENTLDSDAFTEWDKNESDRDLVPHEFSHSWSGKYRRPARLWTPDYRQPMQGDLLWAYEGQDEFWGLVLAARSGLQSKDMVLGQLASIAGKYSEQAGRRWRSIEDTGFDPALGYRKPKPWPSLARGTDYYSEGALFWLEADQLIRQGTGGRKSIDDFARAFFGMNPGDWGQLTFEQADVEATLNAVYPHDWKSFIDTRLNQPDQPAPLGGIEAGGYRLIWKDQPNSYDKARMAAGKNLSLVHSLGLVLDKDGKVGSVQWDSPAFNAGIVNGTQVVAVGGLTYSADTIKQAIQLARQGGGIELLLKRGDRYRTIRIDYRGGLRWPWLERTAAGKAPAGLDLLLAPKRPLPKAKTKAKAK